MGTTPNYGWAYPDPTDLVKDLPADFELFADAVDADLDGLLGGTTGQILAKTSAADHDFGWVAPSGITQLATGSLSGAAVNLTSISGAYKNLQLVIRNFIPATDGTDLLLRLNADTATRYRQIRFNQADQHYAFSESSVKIVDNQDNGTAGSLVVVDLLDYANTVTWKMLNFYSLSVDSTTVAELQSLRGNGFYNQTGAITEINLLCASGNFTSGTYILYGVS